MIQDLEGSRLDNAWKAGLACQPDDRVLVFDGYGLMVRRDEGAEGFELPRVADVAIGVEDRLRYYFSLDGVACWGLAKEDARAASGFAPVGLRKLRTLSASNAQMLAAFTGWHLFQWYRTHRYCGVCGSPNGHAADERALECPGCKNRAYPRINPAVIVGVVDPGRGRIVLTRYARGRGVTYDALIAGFAEIGETFEQCVAREVREEVGLAVKNIRYAGSQPWGIASDLLAGFWCEVDGDATLRVDEHELSRAVWASPKEIVGQPDDLSLTNWMMCSFRDGTSPFGPQTA